MGSLPARTSQRVCLPIRLPFLTATVITVPAFKKPAMRLKRTRRVADVFVRRFAGQVFHAHLTVIFERLGARTSKVRTRAPRAVTVPAKRITGNGFRSKGVDAGRFFTVMLTVSVWKAPLESSTRSL